MTDSYDYSQNDNSYDVEAAMILRTAILQAATRLLILLRIPEIAQEVTLSDIPDYTEDTSDDSGQDNNENWDYIDNGDGSDSDNGG